MDEPQKELPQTDGAPAPTYKGRWLLGCSLTAAVAVLATAVAVWGWLSKGERLCAQFSQALRAAAEEQLAARPHIPEETNAATFYRQAFGLFVQPADQNFYDKLGDQPRDFKGAGAAQHLADNAAYLQAIRAAVQRPGCDFEVELSKGIDAPSPHVSSLRQMARFLSAAARHEAQMGRPAQALDRLALLQRVAQDAGEDCLISRMVRCACEGIFAQALQNVLNESDPDRAEIEKLAAQLERAIRERPRMAPVLKAESAMASITLAEVLSGRRDIGMYGEMPGESNTSLGRKVWRLSGRAAKGARIYVRYMEECSTAAEMPHPECVDALLEIDRQTELAGAAAPRDYALCGLIRPAVGRLAESDANAEARLKLCWLALGCRLHKLKTGKWPAALTDVPAAFPEHFKELPADPFSGKAPVYKKTPGGCLIYSIGRNRKDDGGIPWDSGTSVGDVPFELGR